MDLGIVSVAVLLRHWSFLCKQVSIQLHVPTQRASAMGCSDGAAVQNKVYTWAASEVNLVVFVFQEIFKI